MNHDRMTGYVSAASSSSLLGIKADLSVMQSQRSASVGSSYNSGGLPLSVRSACMVALILQGEQNQN